MSKSRDNWERMRTLVQQQGWRWWRWWWRDGAAFTQRRRHWTPTVSAHSVKLSAQTTLLFNQLVTSARQSHLAHL